LDKEQLVQIVAILAGVFTVAAFSALLFGF
jgi:hypothetical protein